MHFFDFFNKYLLIKMMVIYTLTTDNQIFDENLLILKTTALNNFYHCNASVYR
jgi:hypothetical protein